MEQEKEALNLARKDLKTRLGAYREEQGPSVKRLRTGDPTTSAHMDPTAPLGEMDNQHQEAPTTHPINTARKGRDRHRAMRKAGRRKGTKRKEREELQDSAPAPLAPQQGSPNVSCTSPYRGVGGPQAPVTGEMCHEATKVEYIWIYKQEGRYNRE